MKRTPVDGRVAGEKTAQMYEEKNDQLVNQLQMGVSELKSLTIQIGDAVKESNANLDGMTSDMGSVADLLKGSMSRVKKLAESGDNRVMCYMVMFVVVVFFVIYYLAS